MDPIHAGAKISRSLIKNRDLKVAQSIKHPVIKHSYDKKRSPADNIRNLGLEPDANNLECSKDDSTSNLKFKAFQGFADVEKMAKIRKLDEFQVEYAKSCIEAHGNNYDAMFKDVQVNYNQMSIGRLKKLCNDYIKQTECDGVT